MDEHRNDQSILRGIDHVQLAMPPGGEERARAFYGKFLGLPEVAKPVRLSRRGGCWFQGEVSVHLGVEPNFVPARKAHPAFLVSSPQELRRRADEAGYATQGDDAWPGVVRFYLLDPFGNRLEFLARTGSAWWDGLQ